MKKLYFVFAVFLFFLSGQAQIINFPDANFKSRLLNGFTTKDINGANIYVDVNTDGEISAAEALAVYRIVMQTTPYNITDITGIEYFTNLKQILFSQQPIANVNLTMLPNLEIFENPAGNISTLQIQGLANLRQVRVYSNQITNVDFTGLSALTHFIAYNNAFTGEVDMSPCINLLVFQVEGYNLNRLNIKNGRAQFFTAGGSSFTFTNLNYLCVDEDELDAVVAQLNSYPSYTGTVQVNSYCSFVPGGNFYTVQGNTKFDSNNNGCDESDLSFARIKFNITNGTSSGSFVAQGNGNYAIPVAAGTHTITPVLENPNYFNVSPAAVTVQFPENASPFTQDFCITPNGIHPDLEIVVVPVSLLRPGFDTVYKLIYRNKGNSVLSGNINFSFDDNVLDFVSAIPNATQASNVLSWSFANLAPFESRAIEIVLNANSPTEIPALHLGDIVSFTATILPVLNDETPTDNTFTLNQTVVNAFDPNDKTCLEGNTITPEMVGKEVHYRIRFENSGTANAENIVVKDLIDTTKFDIASLIPIDGSHPFVTRISNTNKVEFIFENINLPFDDANNDGYVAFKIKTKPTLVLGDTFSNTASIYFDYNFPIITNDATTTVAALANQDFTFENYINVYPNPAHAVLNIDFKKEISITSFNVYNTLGQLVLVIPNADKVKTIDVSSLRTGNYFLKVNSDKGSANMKFIKQ